MKKIQEIFNFSYGNKFDKNKMDNSKFEVFFIGRSAKNNGVVDYVRKKENIKPYKKGAITVALGGSILSSFVQSFDFYTSQNVAVLEPKEEMTLQEKLFYCYFIELNKESYSAFGREANRTLKDLLVPEKHEIPSWVCEIEMPDYSDVVEPKEDKIIELPSSDKWKEFLFPEVFEMIRGRGGKSTDAKNNPGNNFYIGASAENNGITRYTSLETTEKGNAITVANNGSVGASFYQKNDFLASSDVTVITLKNKELNPFIALFLTTLIKQIGESFDYGRKWGITRMKESKISLPVDSNRNPDWRLMEDYIKSLPYSKYL